MSVFRQRKINWLITYPKCNLDLEDIYNRIKTKIEQKGLNIIYCVICKEKHQDGEDHRHVYLHLSGKLELLKKDMRFFDLERDNAVDWNIEEETDNLKFHPNVQDCKSPKDAIRYVKKNGNYST